MNGDNWRDLPGGGWGSEGRRIDWPKATTWGLIFFGSIAFWIWVIREVWGWATGG